MSLERDIALFLAQEEKRKTQLGQIPADSSTERILDQGKENQLPVKNSVYSNAIMNSVVNADRGPMAEFIGEMAWGFADEYTLGGLGMAEEYDWLERSTGAKPLQEGLEGFRDITQGGRKVIDPATGESYRPGPQSFMGKLGGGVGVVGGFIAGAPQKILKIGGKALTWTTALATRKKTFAKTLKQIQKSTEPLTSASPEAAIFNNVLHGATARAVITAARPGKLNNVDNFAQHISSGIKGTIDDAVESGLLDRKTAESLGDVYTKYLSDRPLTSMVDYFTTNATNSRLAYTVGSIIQEGLQFGILDGIRAGVHVGFGLDDEIHHHYDLMEPVWGLGIGGAFGALKWMKPAGKSASSRVDFKSGVRAALEDGKNILKTDGYATLKAKTEAIGADAKILGQHIKQVKVGEKTYSFDLTSVESEAVRVLSDAGRKISDEAKADLVREVLGKTVNDYGKQLMKWAWKENWANVAENWPKMVLGAGIMNARLYYDMYQGQPVGTDDLMVNVLIGAYLNRRGTPRRTDMFPETVQRLRSGLHTLNILPKEYIKTNPFRQMPTLDPARSSSMNPFASDIELNKIVQAAKELGLTTNNFDKIDQPIEIVTETQPGTGFKTIEFATGYGKRSVSQSGEPLPLFHEFYRFLEGATTDKYVRNLDNIPESAALKIEAMLRKKFDNEADMRTYMRKRVDNAGDRFEAEIVGATVDLMNILGVQTGGKGEGSIGKIPSVITVNDVIMKAAEAGTLHNYLDSFKGVKNQADALRALLKKANIMTNTSFELMRANKKETDQAFVIKDFAQIEAIRELIKTREIGINNELGIKPDASNAFKFENAWQLTSYLKSRLMNRKASIFSRILDRNLDTNQEMFQVLLDSGLLKADGLNLDPRRISDISKINIVDNNFVTVKDSRLVSDHQLFLSSVLEVLGAKGQYNVHENPVNISLGQIQRLRNYLNNKGVNTDGPSLAAFSTEVVRRITYQNFKDSKLTQENVGVFQAFHSLGGVNAQDGSFHIMKYDRISKGKPVGIVANKIAYEGSDVRIQEIVKEYNSYVDSMIRNGKIEGKQENFVKEGSLYTITNENTFLTIQSILYDAIHKTAGSARKELMDFMLADLSKSKARDATLTFMSAYPEKTSKLIKLMINNGTLELKKNDGSLEGTYEYYVNKEKFNQKEIQSKILEFIDKHGINLDTLETMTSNAEKQLETYLEQRYGVGDHKAGITVNDFFKTYLPEKPLDPTKMSEYLVDKLYDINNNLRDFTAINEILNEMNIPRGKEQQAYQHLMQIVSNKVQGVTKKVIYWSDGQVKVKDTDLASYRTPYFTMLDKIGLKYALVDGTSHDWVLHPETNKLLYQPLDIFQNNSTIIGKADRQMIQQRRELFLDMLNGKKDIEGFESGMTFIEMPGLKMSLAVSKADIDLVRTAFNEMYTRQIANAPENSLAKKKLEHYKKALEQSLSMDDFHVPEAIKMLIAESMFVGKNKNKLIDYLEMGPGDPELNKMFVGRQKLFNTMKFKRIDKDLITAFQESNMFENGSRQDIVLEKYLTKNKFGVALYNDGLNSFDLKTMFEAENGKGSWQKYYGERARESSHDSISFISREMAEFLGLAYGAPGSKVFKPVISSQGKGNLLYGKTEFVYDPKLDNFFNKNKGIDILMASSAEKLKLYEGKEILQVEKQDFYNIGKVSEKLIIDIPLEAVGVQKIPDHFTPGKLAPSVMNTNTDIDIARSLYADYFADNIAIGMKNMSEILKNPFVEYELMRRIKEGQSTGKYEDLELLDSYDAAQSLQLEWLKVSPYASIDVFGPNAKMNPLKARFLDQAMAPSTEYYHNNKRYRFGAKSTLMQTMDTALQGTLFNPETGKIERYGEVMLPEALGAEDINFAARNYKVKVINKKTNEISDAEVIFNKFGANKSFSYKDIANSARPLESLFNVFERGALKDYDLAISTMRFPRTRPNDLTLLRLRGFKKGSGNATEVNPYDVYHIFEGDYDIDAVDFTWAGSDAWYSNIKRQNRVFVPTADATKTNEILPEIELGSLNPSKASREWSTLNGNQRAMSGARGLVQATSALVKHADNIAVSKKNEDGSIRKVLLRNPNKKEGEVGYWEVEMDWNNGDFHLRQALEGQIMLDASSPDPNLINKVKDWRYEFLFPEYNPDPMLNKTLAKEDFIRPDGSYNTTNLRSFINGKKTTASEYSNHRVRLFRRYEYVNENGNLVKKEVRLQELDIDLIKGIFNEYSKLLEVSPGRKVYQNGGSKNANYEDILIRGQRYFLNAKNFRGNMFYKMKNAREYDDIAKQTYNKYTRSVNSLLGNQYMDYFGPKSFRYTDANNNVKYDKTKQYATKSPFPEQLEQNMLDRHNGTQGGVVERIIREIYSQDPLNSLHTNTKFLTKDAFIKQENLSNQLLHNDAMDIAEMNNFIPALLGNINKDISTINSLKYQWVKLNKSYFKGKKAKLEELNKKIQQMEEKLKPLLNKAYWKSRKTKDIDRFSLVDIQSDKNIIDGTVQFFTLAHLARAFPHNKNSFGFKSDLKELRAFLGSQYAGQRDLWGTGEYGNRSIFTTETKSRLTDVMSTKDIELRAEDMLLRGVQKHGISFLWEFAMPSATSTENKIGIFNGNVMPVAINPSGNYKRAVKFLLKGKSGQLGTQPGFYNRDMFKSVLEGLAEIDFTWRRFFNGQNQHLPLDAMETSKLITYQMPKWSWKMNNMFSKYTDIKSDKEISPYNPFGMGKKYDMNIAFFRSLSNLDRSINGEAFESGTAILSYTNQLMMENGYLTPQKHLALMADISNRLGPTMEKVFPSTVDIHTGNVTPIKPFDMLNNPMYVLLGGSHMSGSGMSLDPYRSLNKYEKLSMNKMIQQVKDMKDTKKDSWRESFFETDIRLDINKKAEDC
ncbi:MAG: hypothetical protein Tp152DCM46671_24 [Prokaryotic dsDNA virus sp.]|nr:MAG: hypothetical protein Tp152DCM46671_24 [Prokaryotic dsDNA virus sp.]|tara:strand:- start:13229 stop:21853 length:8625 start_codon:yes stop_codon:yes gene_type:complete